MSYYYIFQTAQESHETGHLGEYWLFVFLFVFFKENEEQYTQISFEHNP